MASYARTILGYCDEPSPGTAPDATLGVWCTRPIGHDGPHLSYGIDCWSEGPE